MQSKISLGIRYILGWENSLKKLKEVRYKRNQLSHGEVPFMASWATNEDITFVCNLRHSILCGQDPLALLRKEMEGAQTPKPSFSQSPNIISSPPISVITPASVSATPTPKKRAPSIGIIVLLALACASFLLFLIVIIYRSFI